MHKITVVMGAMFAALAAASAHAQNYPAKTVRIVVPFPAGGSTDIIGRVVAEQLTAAFGQQAIVDNRPGANGVIGTELVAKAAPDGYTLLTYDPVRDFTAIIQIAQVPNVLVVHPSLPVKTAKGLIALAKANPGKLTFSSSGSGSSDHMSGELFKSMGRVDLVHVPYKGGAPAITDAIAGQVSMTFSNQPTALPHVKTGKLRGIAVTSIKRSSAAPELPTIDESGIKGFDVSSWVGVNAPANLPREIVSRLNAEIVKGMSSPAGRERLNQLAFDPVLSTPDQYAAHIKAEVAKWAQVAKTAGAKLD
ncbi:MAG: tripartite tricarboxylate transporter substrate binding protein [Proteobacteria bacterium]|nr:tripartite tricarboxylate transporter substrate binding protein [Pseudomonadota bacterium]